MPEKKPNRPDDADKTLPAFYQSITPLFSETHAKLSLKTDPDYSFAADATGIVLAAAEFPAAQRDYAIVFNTGDRVMPVALTGAPGARNQFVEAAGKWRDGAYIPSYVRRYPFILAKIEPDAEDLTLCFDAGSDRLVEGRTGNLFNGDEPSERARAILQLCKWFENAIVQTEKFVAELEAHDLLMDAEANIRLAGQESVLFHGFQVVSEEKVRNLPDAETQALTKSSALALIHAHLFSLQNIETLFARHHAARAQDAA